MSFYVLHQALSPACVASYLASILLTTDRCSMVMAGNIAGIYGAQIFREEDNPLYRRGFNIGIGILATSCCLAIVRYIDSKFLIRRQKREKAANQETIEDETSSGREALNTNMTQ